ncbi:E3 ubiquitin-protein ligase RHA1B-like [Phalaenopsis equestris]|uniref:E3 ubiquitin-protein ligase RHA1B-like n=1 Tax=Phalaenopsis equestris TaxID=78828 RepID=UPI0009E6559F|nr:E3 ubiquitin-protein ligase RHA1B-like [Phalaenopsis equestris]
MGFVCFPMSANKLPGAILTFLKLIDIIHYGLLALLYRLGLNPSFESELSPWADEALLFSGEPPRSVSEDAALLKNRLPAVEYMTVARRNGRCGGRGATCVVCLQELEARDKVRVLGNCSHEFHVACIDRWVDIGRFSCPLCRADLLPPAGRRTAGGGLLRFVDAVKFAVFRCG